MNLNQNPARPRLLNLACGAKISSVGEWVNIDFSSPLKNVISMDIIKGINLPEMSFDVVYTAQFVEHLTLSEGESVLSEILRVLKPGGILRIVTPDLEELVLSYLNYLGKLKTSNDPFDENRYDWIRIELFDQIVRDSNGGEMTDVLSQCDEKMKNYLSERIGYSYKGETTVKESTSILDGFYKLRRIPRKLLKVASTIFDSEATKIGKFRKSGEVHRYVHDFYSLSRLLSKAGFTSVSRVDAVTSEIPDWSSYELDIISGVVDGPLCLYVESRRGLS